MKVSISLPPEDLEFVDAETGAGRFESRSAVVHAAIRLLRDRNYVNAYASAWDEWDAEGGEAWDVTSADGLS